MTSFKHQRGQKTGKSGAQKGAWRKQADRAVDDGPIWLFGTHAVKAALSNKRRKPIRLLCTLNAADSLQKDNIPLPFAPEDMMPRQIDHEIGQGHVHQGIALQVERLEQPRLDQVLTSLSHAQDQSPACILFLDQVTDPHNVGAIMRSAAAFGARAIVQTSRNGVSETGTLAKTACGAFEVLPLISVTNLARALDEVADAGFLRIGLAGEGTQTPNDIDKSRDLAIVLGAEGKGLRAKTMDTCDHLMRLPMPGLERLEAMHGIDSLNVSNAAAVTLYALT